MIHLFHKWKIVGFKHFVDVSWGYRNRSTGIIWKCSRCHKTKSDNRYGQVLEPEDFKEYM